MVFAFVHFVHVLIFISICSFTLAVNFDLAYAMPFASCRLSLSYQDKLILHLITPLAFLVSIQLAKLLAVCVDKKRRKPDAIRNTAQDNKSGTVLIQIGMLLYPSLMTRIFSAFRCFPVVMGSQVTRSFLEGDFSIACCSRVAMIDDKQEKHAI